MGAKGERTWFPKGEGSFPQTDGPYPRPEPKAVDGEDQQASLLTLLVPWPVGKDLAGGANVLILPGYGARRAGQRLGKSRRSGSDARSGPPGLRVSRTPPIVA